jgi:hypothetical protein
MQMDPWFQRPQGLEHQATPMTSRDCCGCELAAAGQFGVHALREVADGVIAKQFFVGFGVRSPIEQSAERKSDIAFSWDRRSV